MPVNITDTGGGDPDLIPLHNDKRWTEFKDYVYKMIDQREAKYDKPLKEELLAIWHEDQDIRNEAIEAWKKTGKENPIYDSLTKIIQYKDSIHLIKIAKILDEQGWVGKDKVGVQANQTLWLVIQHSNLKTQQKYLPIMRNAVKEGKCEARWLALTEDRIALREGRKQIYGSQLNLNKETNKYYVAPLEDPDNVDKRRIGVGLEPIKEYLKQWDIIWNVEEYKKQLPELELLNKVAQERKN